MSRNKDSGLRLMDGMNLTGIQCAGPLPGIAPVSLSPTVGLFKNKKVVAMDDLKAKMDRVGELRSNKPQDFAPALQRMKTDVVKHFEKRTDLETLSQLTVNLVQLKGGSLLSLPNKAWNDLVGAAIEAHLKADDGSRLKMSNHRLNDVVDALTTNPYQPWLLEHLLYNNCELLVRILVQANPDRLTSAELSAIYSVCQQYMQTSGCEGQQLMEHNPETQMYIVSKKTFLPMMDPRCFDSFQGVPDNLRADTLKQSYSAGGTGKAVAYPEGFTFVAEEKVLPFDYSNGDMRCLKMLDIGSSLCTGGAAQFQFFLGGKMMDSKFEAACAKQSQTFNEAQHQLRDITSLHAQALMRHGIPSFNDDGKFNFYQRTIYIDPDNPELVIFNTDAYQPRVGPDVGGPWMHGTLDPTTKQPIFDSSANWPEAKLPTSLLLTDEELASYTPPAPNS